jgi:hypothetical protein
VVDLGAVRQQLGVVRAALFAELAHEHETLEVRDEIVEVAEAVHQAASSNAMISSSTGTTSVLGGAGLSSAAAISAPTSKKPIST